jgi:hypothetical protein
MAGRVQSQDVCPRNAGAAIAKRRILKYGSSDELVIQAAAATDLLIGISDSAGDIPAPSGSEYYRADVIRHGDAYVDCGGTITRGQYITADANGKAVVASPAAGVNVYYVAQATQSGVSGGVISCFVRPGVIQGAA